MVNDITEAQITNFFKWNLEVMASGVHPVTDHLGRRLKGDRAAKAHQPLAGGYRAVFNGWCGDLKERVKVHRFCRSFNRNFVCERCLGCRHLAFGNAYEFRRGAAWRRMKVSTAMYMQSTPRDELSPWASVPGWSLEANRPDTLHMLWLGVAKDVTGQLLLDFAQHLHDHTRRDVNDCLADLWVECSMWCWSMRVDVKFKVFTTRTVSWASNGDYPTIETQMKAAKSKWLFVWVASRAMEMVKHGHDTSTYAKRRALMAWHLLRFVWLCDRSKLFFSHRGKRSKHTPMGCNFYSCINSWLGRP